MRSTPFRSRGRIRVPTESTTPLTTQVNTLTYWDYPGVVPRGKPSREPSSSTMTRRTTLPTRRSKLPRPSGSRAAGSSWGRTQRRRETFHLSMVRRLTPNAEINIVRRHLDLDRQVVRFVHVPLGNLERGQLQHPQWGAPGPAGADHRSGGCIHHKPRGECRADR